MIDDEVRKMSIAKRNCFLENERKLKYFTIYTKSNCEQECLSLMIAKKCRCVPFYLISLSLIDFNSILSKLIFQEAEKIKSAEREINFVLQAQR